MCSSGVLRWLSCCGLGYLITNAWAPATGKTPGPADVRRGLPRSFVLGDEEVPAVEAVFAAVDDQVTGLPRAFGRWVGDQVRPSAAVDARDHRIDLHRRAR